MEVLSGHALVRSSLEFCPRNGPRSLLGRNSQLLHGNCLALAPFDRRHTRNSSWPSYRAQYWGATSVQPSFWNSTSSVGSGNSGAVRTQVLSVVGMVQGLVWRWSVSNRIVEPHSTQGRPGRDALPHTPKNLRPLSAGSHSSWEVLPAHPRTYPEGSASLPLVSRDWADQHKARQPK